MTKRNLSHPLNAAAGAAAQERLKALCGAVFAGSLRRRDQLAKITSYAGELLGDGGKSMEEIGWKTLGAQWQGIQNLISDCVWDDAPAWDEISTRLAAAIEPDALLIDESGNPKSGECSVGVARQRCGRLGKIETCQVIISAHLSGKKGSGMVGSQLLIPEEWAGDPERRAKAHVPAALVHETPAQIAACLVARQRYLGHGHLVVLADCAYGYSSDFRMDLEAHEQPYVLQTQSNTRVRPAGDCMSEKTGKRGQATGEWEFAQPRVSVRTLARRHKADFKDVVWTNPAVGTPGAGTHKSRFAVIQVRPAMKKYEDAYTRQGVLPPVYALLVEWPKGSKDAERYWLCSMPPNTSLGRLVELAKRRYRVEQDYHELKSELGLDKFQGRLYHGFAHHVVSCAAAQLFLTLERVAGHWRAAWSKYVGPRCSYSIATIRRFVHGSLATFGAPGSRAGPYV